MQMEATRRERDAASAIQARYVGIVDATLCSRASGDHQGVDFSGYFAQRQGSR